MARKPTESEVTQFIVTDEDTPEIHSMYDVVKYLDAMEVEASDNARALAKRFNYEGSLTVGSVEDEIRFYQRRTAEACLELGKRLLILKELTPHGDFKERVKLLDIEYTTATRFMSATMKFSNVGSNQLLNAANSQTKLLELLVLDDGEIEALENGETVRGLKLDVIETMSVSELKKALRASREETQLKIDIIKQKESKLNEQDEELVRIKRDAARLPFTDWPAAFAGYFAYLEENRHELKRRIAMLEIIRGDAFKIEPQPGEEAMLEQAQKALADELVEMHNQCAEHLETIGLLFDKTLGAYSDKRIQWLAQLCHQ